MNDSSSNHLNESDLNYSFESNQVDEVWTVHSRMQEFLNLNLYNGHFSSRYVVDEQFVPKVGMTFKTLKEARKFYKYYFKLAGFSTKIRNTTRKRDEIKNLLITCSREGKWKSKISPTLKTNTSARINCPTRIYIHILKDVGLWVISKVILNHSHSCCPDTYQSFVVAAGGHRELIDHSIKYAFWADTRSRTAYEYFGDVVSFDTTYNTNRYNLVLGSFMGVNHHGQSTLLRCALMKNDDIQSFKWLFECWLRCMGEKAPEGILTDRCASMQRAIETCISTTIHRWCIWHIMKKIPSKLNGYKRHEEIKQEIFDVADFYTVILCATKSPIEAQF
ncbi:hypothetical protein Ahy_A07g032957 [Arachis hypogaea]|uniref:Uncharacterized protein n=1 Tax=Arachis hypogaea TaxID=3818 RepID=A0A445C7X1_ARAHY|nr:hypothetical protein Ahy_A07g032957 [Arachis hypogaea]